MEAIAARRRIFPAKPAGVSGRRFFADLRHRIRRSRAPQRAEAIAFRPAIR
jgi:hypothetical protein